MKVLITGSRDWTDEQEAFTSPFNDPSMTIKEW